MSETAWLSPGTAANIDLGGTIAWVNENNIKVNDSNYATATTTYPEITNRLVATNFGFSIPAGATINGVVVENKTKDSYNASNGWDNVRLIKGGVSGGTNHRPLIDGTNEIYVAAGSSSDLWGLTLTPSDVNSSDFGVGFYEQPNNLGNPRTISVNHIRMKIYYTEIPTTPVVGTKYALPAFKR